MLTTLREEMAGARATVRAGVEEPELKLPVSVLMAAGEEQRKEERAGTRSEPSLIPCKDLRRERERV